MPLSLQYVLEVASPHQDVILLDRNGVIVVAPDMSRLSRSSREKLEIVDVLRVNRNAATVLKVQQYAVFDDIHDPRV